MRLVIILELFNLLTDNGKLQNVPIQPAMLYLNILINAKFIAAMNVEF